MNTTCSRGALSAMDHLTPARFVLVDRTVMCYVVESPWTALGQDITSELRV